MLLVERLWGKYSFNGTGKLANYISKSYRDFHLTTEILEKVKKDDYLETQEVNAINGAVSKVIEFSEVRTIIDNSPPDNKKSGDLHPPFLGYYISVNRNWKPTLGNNWDEIQTMLGRSLRKRKPNFSGFKTYALLKGFVKNYLNDGIYEVSTVKLVSDANNELGHNSEVRVWFNHFNDLIGSGTVYNTRSNKYGEMTILPEVIPLVKHVLKEFEQENGAELNNLRNGKTPF